MGGYCYCDLLASIFFFGGVAVTIGFVVRSVLDNTFCVCGPLVMGGALHCDLACLFFFLDSVFDNSC